MNIEEGIHQLSQLFMYANSCMERGDCRAAINEYNKIIELVQILRKPFDNGEVPLNVVMTVFPKILEAEKAARSALAVAQLGIEAQKKSAENRAPANTTQPEEIHSDNISDAKQYTQHMFLADYHMEKEDYHSAIDEYNKALDKIRTLKFWLIKQADKTPANQFSETMEKINMAEEGIHAGLFVAYFKTGNKEKAAEEQKERVGREYCYSFPP